MILGPDNRRAALRVDSSGRLLTAGGVGGFVPTLQAYFQPDSTGVWAARPAGLSIPVPSGASKLTMILWGGGAGGGSGRRGAAATSRTGGGGGCSGTGSWYEIVLASVGNPASILLTCGLGGAGGGAVTVNDTNGSAGAVGTATVVTISGQNYVGGATGNGGGGGGVGAGSAGGGQVASTLPTQSGGASAANAVSPNVFSQGPAGGGTGGGNLSNTDVVFAPGQSAMAGFSSLMPTSSNGASGVSLLLGNLVLGSAGAGGVASLAANGGAGGNGGPGAGGGGGAAAVNGFNAGAGGLGGFGWATLLWE